MKNDKNQTISQRFNRAASTYDASSLLQQQSAQVLLDWMQPHLFADQIICDAGCGTGLLTRALANKGCRVWAVDLALHMLNGLDGENNIQTICADMADLPMPDAMLDALVSNFSAHWLGVDVLKEWLRVVKPNGDLWLALPVAGSLKEVATRFSGFSIFDFQPAQVWLDACAPYLVSTFEQTFSQSFAHLRMLVQALRQMGGNQLGHLSNISVAKQRQLWKLWLAQEQQSPSPIELSYHVLFLHLKTKPLER